MRGPPSNSTGGHRWADFVCRARSQAALRGAAGGALQASPWPVLPSTIGSRFAEAPEGELAAGSDAVVAAAGVLAAGVVSEPGWNHDDSPARAAFSRGNRNCQFPRR